MAREYIFLIALGLLLFTSAIKQQYEKAPADQVVLLLASNVDTCKHSDDKVELSIVIRNNGPSILRVNKRMPICTYNLIPDGFIRIYIKHDENIYVSPYLYGKESMPRWCLVTKKRPLIRNAQINLKKLHVEINGPYKDYIGIKPDNRDFGIYKIKVIYIRENNQTVSSNWITINYLQDYGSTID